jgi:hypothetical protein
MHLSFSVLETIIALKLSLDYETGKIIMYLGVYEKIMTPQIYLT